MAALLAAPATWAAETLGHATSSTFPAGGSGQRVDGRPRRSRRSGGPGSRRSGRPAGASAAGGAGGRGGRRSSAPGRAAARPGSALAPRRRAAAWPASRPAAPAASGGAGGRGGFGGTGGFGGGRVGGRRHFGGDSAALKAAVSYAKAHGGGTIGVSSQSAAAAAILSSNANVAGLGGFSGRESSVSVSWLAMEVRTGHLRWVIADARQSFRAPGDTRQGSQAAMAVVAKVCKVGDRRLVRSREDDDVRLPGRAAALLAAAKIVIRRTAPIAAASDASSSRSPLLGGLARRRPRWPARRRAPTGPATPSTAAACASSGCSGRGGSRARPAWPARRPTRRCGSVSAASATTSNALEQIGSEVDCSARGTVVSSAWYELVPAPSRTIRMTVRPGDELSAEVTVAGHEVTLMLRDLTRATTRCAPCARRDRRHHLGRLDRRGAVGVLGRLLLPDAAAGQLRHRRLQQRRGRSPPPATRAASPIARWNVTKITLAPRGRRFIGQGSSERLRLGVAVDARRRRQRLHHHLQRLDDDGHGVGQVERARDADRAPGTRSALRDALRLDGVGQFVERPSTARPAHVPDRHHRRDRRGGSQVLRPGRAARARRGRCRPATRLHRSCRGAAAARSGSRARSPPRATRSRSAGAGSAPQRRWPPGRRAAPAAQRRRATGSDPGTWGGRAAGRRRCARAGPGRH